MFEIVLLGGFFGRLAADASKCFKRAFWESPGGVWRPRLQNCRNGPPGDLLGAFGGQGFEMLQTGLLGASWGRLATKALKCFKRASWELPGGAFGGQGCVYTLI